MCVGVTMSGNVNSNSFHINSSMKNNTLKILSFNVENLTPKLDDQEFLSLMEGFDLCLFTETWLTSDEKIGLPSFWDFHFVRAKKTKCGRNSGGISAFVKKKFRPGVKVVSMEEGFLWLKIDRVIFGLSNHLYICVAYIPPQSSKCISSARVDYFQVLSDGIANFSNDGDVILTGDFNSRVGNSPYIVNKAFENLDKYLPPGSSTVSSSSRLTCDNVQNTYGRRLNRICESFNLNVANGRTTGDILGNFTCFTSRGPSVVDLVIGDCNSMKMIKRLKVLPPNFNSVHCPISFDVKYGALQGTPTKRLDPRPVKFKWDPSKESNFINAIKNANWNSLDSMQECAVTDDANTSLPLTVTIPLSVHSIILTCKG